MSNYIRVLPRDLFNEASLLKCYGRLWILLDNANSNARIVTEDVEYFDIVQNQDSGGITVRNISLVVNGRECALERPLNSRSDWPLYLTVSDDDDIRISVLDDDGNLSSEMQDFIA